MRVLFYANFRYLFKTPRFMNLDAQIVKTSELPEHFQPPAEDSMPTAELPSPLLNLLEAATQDLTREERYAFLTRIQSEREKELREDSRPKEGWRELVIEWLKEEANRFMAAAVAVRSAD
jgi:hypothetical protein